MMDGMGDLDGSLAATSSLLLASVLSTFFIHAGSNSNFREYFT